MRAIADLDFKYCTPIQIKALRHVRAGENVAGRAQTGTGKTAAFLIAIFSRFLLHPVPGKRRRGTPRALVIAPTRELVIQIARDAHDLGRYCGLRCVAVYGGMDYDSQRRELTGHTIDLVAATPGRLLDFARSKVLDLGSVEVLVIDEADRMLDMGFIPDVRRIIRNLPPKNRRQTMLFSATLTASVMRLASQWMPDPVVVEVEPEQVAVETVQPVVYTVTAYNKFRLLYNLLRQPEMRRVLVFGNRRDSTARLADNLKRHGIRCDLLSGAVAQKKRLSILEDFRSGRNRILVATDVAGRGLHVEDISHVINYDFPYEPEDYVHRIGRTGRAGASGVAISFACENESFIIPEIEEYIGEGLACVEPDQELLVPVPRAQARRQTGRGQRGEAGRSRGRSRGDREGGRGRRKSGRSTRAKQA
jgi:ATP-dependent RNA helicase RhlB